MIEITLNGSTSEVSAFGLTQWDKGQKLRIIWSEMPKSFQVHFASRNSQEAIVVKASGENGTAVVEIPDELLKNSADIYAWIYTVDGEKTGESVKRAVLYVRPRAKPHTLVEDLEMTQQEILENILGDINENISEIKKNGVDAQYLPGYLTKEVERILTKVSDSQTQDSVVFIVSSDAHLKNGDYNSETGLLHMSQAMRLITERYPMDFGAYLGDMTLAGEDKNIDDGKKEIMRVRSALFPTLNTMPSFVLGGTEDLLLKAYYRNGRHISHLELKNLIGKDNKNVQVQEEFKERGFFYKDLDTQKVRVICLNTSDTYGKTLTPDSETAVMEFSQLQWLCESLDLSDKADANEWGIILLGHHPLTMINKFSVAVAILDAYCKGNAVDVTSQSGETVSYNFSGKNKARILGQFHGHLHNYKVSFITDSKIPIVCIPNASFYNNNFYSADTYSQAENLTYSEERTYNKSVNTVNDTAFCVIVIDKATGKINAVHYGSGVDRVIDGTDVTEDSSSSGGTETPDEGGNSGNGSGTDNDGNTEGGDGTDSGEDEGGDNTGDGGGDNTGGDDTGEGAIHTNLVPTSITSANHILDGKGYINGYKLNSNGENINGPEYTYTGHIAVSYGDVIRIAGGTYNGSDGNYIFAADKNFNILWFAPLTGSDDESAGLDYKGSGVIVFHPSQVQAVNLENIAYIRVSTIGVGGKLIVTRNEKITGFDETENNQSGGIVSYCNVVDCAMDEEGNTYGTGGFKNGTRLNYDGVEEEAAGYVTIGYLLSDIEGIVRTKGFVFDGAEGSHLFVYDENLALLKRIDLTSASDPANGIVYDGRIHTFTPAHAQDDLSTIWHFRFSGRGTGENIVITYCEEITD